MQTTRYFTAPANVASIHRVTTYDNGAFVSVDVYSSKHATAPAVSRCFPAGDTTQVALFAARSSAAAWVATVTQDHTELTAPTTAANMAW